MDWQQCASLLIVAVAASLLGASLFRRRKFRLSRDTPCGCSAASSGAFQPSITYRVRKGQRPEIVVKWH
jgi:hypothetical protein